MNSNSITNRTQNNGLLFLDGLRGLAAFYVMVGHARWLLWEGGDKFRAHVAEYNLFEKIEVYFFGLFKYGHQMVLFFFVLSGFVIHLRQANALQNGSFKPLEFKSYFFKRLKRILPPLLFAIGLTYCADLIVQNLHASIYNHTTPDALINKNISFDHSLTTFAGNVFFLQQTYVPTFGTNAPLWSLKYEWWFYMLYPLLLVVNRRSAVISFVFVAMLSASSILFLHTGFELFNQVSSYLFCWWLGCFAADIYAERIRIHSWLFLISMGCLAFIFLNPTSLDVVNDSIVALGFWGLLSYLLYLNKRGKKFKFLNSFKPLGDCSYTLYVIHFPLLVLLNAVVLNYSGNVMPRSFWLVWICIFLLPVIAYIIHYITEKPFVKSHEDKKMPKAILTTYT